MRLIHVLHHVGEERLLIFNELAALLRARFRLLHHGAKLKISKVHLLDLILRQ